MILGISNSGIKGVELVVAGGNRDGGLVASKNNRYEHCSMSVRVLSDDVLQARSALK